MGQLKRSFEFETLGRVLLSENRCTSGRTFMINVQWGAINFSYEIAGAMS